MGGGGQPSGAGASRVAARLARRPGADRQAGGDEKTRIESAGRGETEMDAGPTLSLADRFGRLLETGREIVVSTTAPGVLKGVERAVASLLRSDHTFAFPVEPDGQPL